MYNAIFPLNGKKKKKCPHWADLMVIHQDVPFPWNARLPEVRKCTDILTMANIWLESQRR